MDNVTFNWKQHTYDPDASIHMAMPQTDWLARCQLARLLQSTDSVRWVARVALRRSPADTAELRSKKTRTDAAGGFDTYRGITPAALQPRFYRRAAACHVKITALRLPKIGTVHRTPDGVFEAGRIPGIGGTFDTATALLEAWADHARFPRRPDEILTVMRGAPEIQQVPAAVDSFVGQFRTVAPRLACARHNDRGPFPLCHADFLHRNIIVAEDVKVDASFDVLGIIGWEGACTLPLELEARERGPCVGAGGGHTLSPCLAHEHAQALSYAMEGFRNGKMGLYDQVLDDLEAGLPGVDLVQGPDQSR
ncbi:hypothetical protein F503_01642 [Ophiostoma piceae UAMH 11346]|uniref:Aminoglycoside phosphotransferase domain-containing protein n=1 Tax=Ophiostoma piceae (strain UAMH 11346) TaxID=1262450 RepID=S3BTZ0_OPHP1|nr:hypothetical protein F503_01642 [Ophiostoma piceae UAMH 11346]